MANFFNILILEDVKSDALLIEYHLKKAEFKYQTKLVNNKPDFLNAIQKFNPDIILSDYNLPGFSGAEVLEICKEKIPDIPFLFVTGYLDENVAVNFIRKGAWDYILKQNYVRLIPAIENAVKLRNERLKVKLATNFLKKSKQRYQNLYEYAPDMYLTVNFETAFITECNETLAQVTGYQKSEIINHSVYSFYPANTATKIKDVIIPYVLQNGNIKNANLDIIKKDGSLINGLVNINAEYNKYNKIGSIRIVIRNITYRKTQEKALIESEERFKKIFNKSEDPTLILDYVGRKVPIIKNVNTNFVSKIGYQKKHLIGKPINFFLPHISDTEVENQIKKLLTGIKFHDKITLNLPHDITYYYDVVGSLIKLNNKDYILISARDITEKYIADLKLLKEKEKFSALSEEYKSQNDNLYTTIQDLAFSKKELKQKVDIINRSPAVAFSWKNEVGWQVEYVSENSEDFFGYKPKDFISGKIKYADVIHPEDIKRVIKEVEAGIKNNLNKISHKTYRIRTKKGEIKWVKDDTIIVKNNEKTIHFEGIITDITENKIIQEKLKVSELHFRKLFENSIIGMYLTTPDGKIINANKALCNMLEYRTFDELKNLNLEQNKDQSTSRSTFKAIIEKQNSIKGFESVWKTKTGQDIYVRESARKYINENGNIFYEGTVENITKQQKAIKLLKEFHSFNKKIIKIGKLGSATFSKTGDCISVNQSYADIIGATREQVLKQNIYRTKTWKNFGLLINAKKCLSGGIQYKTIIESESSFNKQIWIEIHLSRIYKEKQAQLLVIIKDISSYMKAKQKQFQTKAEYINLIENVNVPVFGVDKNGSINEWNNTLQKLTGYKRNEVKRKKITEFIENSNDCKCLQIIKNASIGKENSNIEINFKTKSQKNLKLLISTTIRKDINNNLDGIIFIGQDITEIHSYKVELENQVEERTHKLIEALKKEKELGDLKSQFVSMASHEFRTPLAAISFASGFVKKYWSRLDELNRNLKLDKINDQVKHMTNLLNDVLTFGKTESGNISYNPKETNLISFLEEVIDEVQIATGNSHKILLNNKNGISMVMLDEKIGRNIFSNLLTNAIKFSPNTNFVTLKIQPLGSEVMIEVIDNGIGINQNEIDYIFTPFHRGQNVSTIQGTGLGLAIVKESVEIMKGTINVESTPGKGTKFKIIFPKNN